MEPEKLTNLASMVLVGALWGCTNPLLRKGAVESAASSNNRYHDSSNDSVLRSTLRLFLNAKVWLPYLFNQSGSIVFYILLANSDLSLAVPVCNSLALVFSLVTGIFVGEPIQKPFRTFIGASLVLLGTTICVSSGE
jgi:hypothetical protein